MQIKEFLTYIKSERRYSSYTFISYRRDLLQFQKFLKTNFDVSNDNEIRFEMIRSWVALLLDSKNSVSTVNRKISTLRSYFKYLITFTTIKKNPITKLVAPKTNKKIPKWRSKRRQVFASILASIAVRFELHLGPQVGGMLATFSSQDAPKTHQKIIKN